MRNWFLIGTKFQFFKMKDILEVEGGNGCTVSLYLMPLNCPLKNG